MIKQGVCQCNNGKANPFDFQRHETNFTGNFKWIGFYLKETKTGKGSVLFKRKRRNNKFYNLQAQVIVCSLPKLKSIRYFNKVNSRRNHRH